VDLTHWMLLGFVGLVAAIVIGGFIAMARILRKDEAIDAATFLALRELRERFEASRQSSTR
jgi:hypothetical protein